MLLFLLIYTFIVILFLKLYVSLGDEFFKGAPGGRGRPGNAGSKGGKGAVVILFLMLTKILMIDF